MEDYFFTETRMAELKAELNGLPFPCIKVIYRNVGLKGTHGATLTGETEDVYENAGGDLRGVDWASRTTLYAVGAAGRTSTTVYMNDIAPNSPPPPGSRITDCWPRGLLDLLRELRDRRSRFVEVAISRQQRRALGISDNAYKEYIVVKRREAPNYALTLGQVARRHPQLHAVRGHMRELASGKWTFVRPHARGKGNAMQVKDYVLA